MTLEQAREILKQMDRSSKEPFTPREKEAIFAIGTALLLGKITKQECAELMGLQPN